MTRHHKKKHPIIKSSKKYPHPTNYAELHCHTNYSFKDGASHIPELLMQAKKLKLYALAITDHDNLCGAMLFAQTAKSLGIKPIIGVELTLASGHHITLLSENLTGYRNICQLVTIAHIESKDRLKPNIASNEIFKHTKGVICLSGCRSSEIAESVDEGNNSGAMEIAKRYTKWFGRNNYFIELQQNLVQGDTARNQALNQISKSVGIGVVATGNAHYHLQERAQLNDALVAIRHNSSLEESERKRRINDQFYLRSPEEAKAFFNSNVLGIYPDAISNTIHIAQRCTLNLSSDKIYSFPKYQNLGKHHTEEAYLKDLCENAATRKYGELNSVVKDRLREEFKLIQKYNLSGLLLQYYDIVRMAREVQEELGLIEPGLPLEVRSPGRGRGSSVALLVGYLIGLSHIDPLQFELKLDRFLQDIDTDSHISPPDIDLDFPREIREQLILRVHQRWGFEYAALTGMISTYRMRGAIRDLGKILGFTHNEISNFEKGIDNSNSIEKENFSSTLHQKPDNPLWRHLIHLSLQLVGFPKYLAQHPGGMILSSRPLSEFVPLQRGAIKGRYICQWDKFSIEDAGCVKIDFLSLGALSQMSEALQLIHTRKEEDIDLTRINFNDSKVYKSIHSADTIGTFQIESAAQMQTVTRLKPENLIEMAWEVGAVRPGVGVNDGVTLLIKRHLEKKRGLSRSWDFDHPHEKKALERTYGVPLYQDQLGELAIHVAGMKSIDGERMRKAFIRPDSKHQIPIWKNRFIQGAVNRGVPIKTAEKIFTKFHGLYQFPESHAYAFGVTAFQLQWLKIYYPLEFYVALFNQQPMGFYSLETIKEDAKRHGIKILNPNINLSGILATIEDEKLRMGLTHINSIKYKTAQMVLKERTRSGYYKSIDDLIQRTNLLQPQLDNLVRSGAVDHLSSDTNDRRKLRWEIGLRYHPSKNQLHLPLPISQNMVSLNEESDWDAMMGEYKSINVYPEGHIMAKLRWTFPKNVISSNKLGDIANGAPIMVAGLVIRRQRPQSKAVFMTLEDEFGHIPLIIWNTVYKNLRKKALNPLLIACGTMSRRDGTFNIMVNDLKVIPVKSPYFKSKDWS